LLSFEQKANERWLPSVTVCTFIVSFACIHRRSAPIPCVVRAMPVHWLAFGQPAAHSNPSLGYARTFQCVTTTALSILVRLYEHQS